jgi:hypothetical protein
MEKKMKRTMMILMVMLVIGIAMIAELQATPALPRDLNSNVMQFHRTFTSERDTTSVVTIRRITVPTNAVEAILLVKTAPIYVSADSTAAVTDDFEVAAGVAVRIPVTKMTKFYYRGVTATAAILNIIWCKD